MQNWIAPPRPNTYAESALISSILDGDFQPGATLPGERTLAGQLGITRSTLREAIQRLARDGWLTVHQGKPTVVNNYWEEGGLNVLSALVEHSEQLPPNFVTHLLEVRQQLAPAYTYAAVSHAPDVIADYLTGRDGLNDSPEAMATFDWRLHHLLTIVSQNPIYTLILNGFADFYERLAQIYFLSNEGRQSSRVFYADLATAVSNHDPVAAEIISKQAMQESIRVWQASKAAQEEAHA